MLADMTKGSPVKAILAFSIPMLIGNIFQQVYNFVDASIVGKYVGPNALAAVGATSGILAFLVSFMMGITNGAGIIISQCFGAKKYADLRTAIANLIIITGAISIFISIAGILFSKRILLLLSTPPEVLPEALAYTKVMFGFMAGMACYNICGAILRSVGDSKTPLYALIIASIMNVALDLLFVVGFHWGVAGAAGATVTAQIFSAVYCFIHMRRHKEDLFLSNLSIALDKSMSVKILKTGLPAALESCLISIGGMSVQSLVNSFGSMTMAAYTSATKIDSIALAPIVSIGNALAVYTGQNIGAGKQERIKKGLYQTLLSLIIICIVITAGIVLFREQLLGLFLNPEEAADAIQIGSQYLTIVCIAYVIAAIMRSYLNVLRGAGDVNTCAVAGITELTGRVIFAYILVNFFGSAGIWIATPIAWGMGAVVPVVRYISGKWKDKQLV